VVLDTNVLVSGIFFGGVPGRVADIEALLGLLAVHAELVAAPALPAPVSSDADDDKFLVCALASGNALIVSGDKHLLDCSGWRGIRVLRPRRFADEFGAILRHAEVSVDEFTRAL
jgi:predicted nucleic acid-binding protein